MFVSDLKSELIDGRDNHERTCCKRWTELICGMRSSHEDNSNMNVQLQNIKSFLKQGIYASVALNFAAVLLIVIVIFITAFYH